MPNLFFKSFALFILALAAGVQTYAQTTPRLLIPLTTGWRFTLADTNRSGRNDNGLVTYDRQTRKDAFYWYQANWRTKAMVHITSKRFWERSQSRIEGKIYSNCEQVELKINGMSLGKTNSPNCRFIWPGVELQPGPNRVRSLHVSRRQGCASIWGGSYRTDGDPLPNKVIAAEDAAARKKSAE
jgi:hypothetical protein